MKKGLVVLLIFCGCVGLVGAIGASPRWIEEFKLGGGYGEAVDGGADFAKNGDIVTDGTVEAASFKALVDTAALIIGSGAEDVDYQIAFDGETNDGTITWMEDENWFLLSDGLSLSALHGMTSIGSLSGTDPLFEFDDDQVDLHGYLDVDYTISAATVSATDGEFAESVTASESLTVGGGVDGTDYTLTFNGYNGDTVLTWMEDENWLEMNQGSFKLNDGFRTIYGTDNDIQVSYDETTDDRLEWSDGTNLLMAVADGGTEGNLYVSGDVSALTFTDRASGYPDDALEAIRGIRFENGDVFHSSVPEEAKAVSRGEPGWSLGPMITINSKAIQQLLERVEALEAANAALVKRVEALEKP